MRRLQWTVAIVGSAGWLAGQVLAADDPDHYTTTQLPGAWAAELRALAPNECRSRIPGLEELGGWLTRHQPEALDEPARTWVLDRGPLAQPDGGRVRTVTAGPTSAGARSPDDDHGARVWAAYHSCAVRAAPAAQYWDATSRKNSRRWTLRRGSRPTLTNHSMGANEPLAEMPEPDPDWPAKNRARDGLSDAGQQHRIFIAAAGNTRHHSPTALGDPMLWGALAHADRALIVFAVGLAYVTGRGYDVPMSPYSPNPEGIVGSSYCREASALCLAAPWSTPLGPPLGGTGTSFSAPMVAAAADAIWAVWPDLHPLDLRNALFECASTEPRVLSERQDRLNRRTLTYTTGRAVEVETGEVAGYGRL